MIAARQTAWLAVACMAAATTLSAQADTTSYEDVDGLRYLVTRRTVQVPTTQVATQQQTVLRQQVTTQTIQQQQLYTVPVTQYQLVSTLHGRWNPFVTPYWTHEYQPVTTWQQQTGTVQIPVNSVAWVPETRTVQAPTTTYRTVDNAVVSKVYVGPATTAPSSQQMMASTGGATTGAASGPTATLAARPSSPSTATGAGSNVPAMASAPTPTYQPPTYQPPSYGGTALPSDPPKQATGWQSSSPPSTRYGNEIRR